MKAEMLADDKVASMAGSMAGSMAVRTAVVTVE